MTQLNNATGGTTVGRLRSDVFRARHYLRLNNYYYFYYYYYDTINIIRPANPPLTTIGEIKIIIYHSPPSTRLETPMDRYG